MLVSVSHHQWYPSICWVKMTKKKKIQHEFCDHVMSLAPSRETLHLFGQDNQNKVQHDCWPCDHMLLALESCDVDGTANEKLHLLDQDNQNELQHDFWSSDVSGTSASITKCQWHCKWHHCIH